MGINSYTEASNKGKSQTLQYPPINCAIYMNLNHIIYTIKLEKTGFQIVLYMTVFG